jgi:hypothetical protein
MRLISTADEEHADAGKLPKLLSLHEGRSG